eukprot:8591635-Prorocentrum_lima.AAC.1
MVLLLHPSLRTCPVLRHSRMVRRQHTRGEVGRIHFECVEQHCHPPERAVIVIHLQGAGWAAHSHEEE